MFFFWGGISSLMALQIPMSARVASAPTWEVAQNGKSGTPLKFQKENGCKQKRLRNYPFGGQKS